VFIFGKCRELQAEDWRLKAHIEIKPKNVGGVLW